jgi:predicted DNA-binding ribbon-helix-helix protein
MGGLVKSLVSKRSIIVATHKTSVSLEDAFWNALKEIAKVRNVTVSDLVGTIDSERQHENLSSAIRLFVLSVYRKELSDLKQGANREINCLGGMSLVEV